MFHDSTNPGPKIYVIRREWIHPAGAHVARRPEGIIEGPMPRSQAQRRLQLLKSRCSDYKYTIGTNY